MLHRSTATRWLTLAAVFATAPLLAQPAAMVKDIGTEELDRVFFSPDISKASLDGVAYFRLDDGIHGQELWRSDGTVAGTRMVVDLCPGICTGSPSWFPMAVWRDAIYFAGDNGATGYELWRTDGTAVGTVLVADLVPGLASSLVRRELGNEIAEFFPTPNRLYFTAATPPAGAELWSTQGTTETTALVADIHPAGSSVPGSFLALGDLLLFFADDGTHGSELWRSDGTTAGTSLVADLNPGSASSWQGLGETRSLLGPNRAALGELAIFRASDATGEKLWRSDGTAAGTGAIYSPASGTRRITAWAGRVLFVDTATGALWATGGTAAGTAQLAAGNFDSMVGLAGVLLLVGSDAAHGRELWVSDGTSAGTHLLKDLRPGSESALAGLSYLPRSAAGTAAFWAGDETHGYELWRSDGTEAGTALVKDLVPGVTSSTFYFFGDPPVEIGGRYVFLARFDANTFRAAIWSTNSGATDASMLVQPDTQTDLVWRFEDWLWRLPEGGPPGVVFTQYVTGSFYQLPLWFSDGTSGGTSILSSRMYDGGIDDAWIGDRYLFNAFDESGQSVDLWVTSGTPASTELLKHGLGSGFVTHGAHSYFAAEGGLWRSDGTAGGTTIVDPVGGNPVASVGPHLYYVRTITQNPSTSALLRITAALGAPETVGVFPRVDGVFASAAGPLLFMGTDSAVEIYRVTENPLGTTLVASWGAEFTSEFFRSQGGPVSTGSKVFYVRDDGGDAELWVTDGTTIGTHKVIDLAPGTRGAFPRDLTAWGSELFFVADDSVHGRELFATDGTEAGTRLVADIIPGPGSSHPKDLAVPNGYLVFSATDGVANRELWVSSGTAAGTFRLQDIAPGALPSSPQGFTLGKHRIFFLANDATHGFELWSMAAAQSAIRVTLEAVPAAAGASVRGTDAPGSTGSNGAEFGYIARAVLTCTNDGPSPATNVVCALINPPPGTTIDCTPPSPVAQLGVGQSTVCQVSFPWNGPVMLTGVASSTTSDPFPNDNLATVTISAPADFSEIPTLSRVGLAALALGLAMLARRRLRAARNVG